MTLRKGVTKLITFKERIEVYRIGLLCGFFSKDEVFDWIDSYIEQGQPNYSDLIDVSLMQNKKIVDIISRLKEIQGNQRCDFPIKVILGLIYKSYIENINSEDKVVSYLHYIDSYESLPKSEERELSLMLDEYSLAEREIYGSTKEVYSRIDRFLSQYAIFTDEFS